MSGSADERIESKARICYELQRKDVEKTLRCVYTREMMPYERFDAWQLCHRLVLTIYKVTRSFPSDERFALTSQARRAAFSAAANIVEGCVKKGPREFRRYLDISIGSLGELRYAIKLATDLGYISPAQAEEVLALHTQASKTTWGLYVSLGKR